MPIDSHSSQFHLFVFKEESQSNKCRLHEGKSRQFFIFGSTTSLKAPRPVFTKLGKFTYRIHTSIWRISPSQVIQAAKRVLRVYVCEWHWKMHNSFSFVRNKLGGEGRGRPRQYHDKRLSGRQLDARGWVITLNWFCQVISTSVSRTRGWGAPQSDQKRSGGASHHGSSWTSLRPPPLSSPPGLCQSNCNLGLTL